MPRVDELRIIARIARMYYEWDMSQAEIASQLGLSQPTVSRFLTGAKQEGIIRTSVNIPHGIYAELEESLVKKFHLRDAIVTDNLEDDETVIQRDIGATAAFYLESTIQPGDVVGISSWSATLLSLVDALHPIKRKPGVKVVQILGGVGSPSAEVHATHLTSRLAALLGGQAIYLPAPGVVGSEAAMKVLMEDEYLRQTLSLFDQVTLALVGIGAVEPSLLLAKSGNIFSPEELGLLRQQGAVGDILLRFFDQHGRLVESPLNKLVISMSLEQLCKVDRVIGVAGGKRKCAAILGALRGGWINILITDHFTAACLAKE
jgi:DNA-binding transcriptional regulator LsrR (DeoR family)